MNKLLWVLTTLTVGLLALAACGGGDDNGGSGSQRQATATSPVIPTNTPLPADASEAQQSALQASEMPEGWVEISGVEVTAVGGGPGASGWAVDFSNEETNETVVNSVFVYESNSEVAEPFNAKFEELSGPEGFTTLPQMGFSAFYAPGDAETPHVVWVRRKNIITSVELLTEGTTGKSDVIVIAKILDDRLAQLGLQR